jgi:hypothetical protein
MKYVLPLRTNPLDPSILVAYKTTSDPLSTRLQFKHPLRVGRGLSFPQNIIHNSFHVLIKKTRILVAAVLNDFFIVARSKS